MRERKTSFRRTVDLLETAAKGLRDEEVHERHSDRRASSVDVTDLRLKPGLGRVVQVGERERDDEGGEPEAELIRGIAVGNELGV